LTPEKKRLDSPENPDVEIWATVACRELRFTRVPQTRTSFWGYPERESVSGTERENLPDEVESGVIYRNSGVRLRIASGLTGRGSVRAGRHKEGKSQSRERDTGQARSLREGQL
jgi:hypothetical protein